MGPKNRKAKYIPYIPVDEYIINFTDQFRRMMSHFLTQSEIYTSSELYQTHVTKSLLGWQDIIEPCNAAENSSEFTGPLRPEVFFGIVSAATAKARQELEKITTRYQNAYNNALVQRIATETKPNNKGKQSNQSENSNSARSQPPPKDAKQDQKKTKNDIKGPSSKSRHKPKQDKMDTDTRIEGLLKAKEWMNFYEGL
ncbi:4954_t:CDS:2 [Rhizophagus irregularis]|nr:4954_t:CDS:2 [Rhizophagus irregularis]